MIKLSDFKRNTFKQCKRQYYYRYVDKTKYPRIVRSYLELGNVTHDALYNFHKGWKDADSNKYANMSEAFKKARIKNHTNIDIAKQSKNCLEWYLEEITEPPPTIEKGLEKSFTFKLNDKLAITGKIDRVDRVNNSYHIIDYKSGRTDTNGKKQLKLYAYAISKMMPDVEYPIKGSIINVRLRKYHHHDFYQKDLELVEEEMMDLYQEIKKEEEADIWLKNITRLCNYCDFESTCSTTP